MNVDKHLNFSRQIGVENKKQNLKNFLDKLFEDVNKFEQALNKLNEKLDLNKSFMEEFKIIESKGTQVRSESFNHLLKILKESTFDYRQRIMQKLGFLVKNWKKKRLKINLLAESTNNPFNKIAILNITYCLASRFIILFNEDGKPDIDILLKNQTNVDLIEYAAELNEILGRKRLDKIFYLKLRDKIIDQLINHCNNNSKDIDNYYCTKNIKFKLTTNWDKYCYIDKNGSKFERPNEWKLQYSEF
uniref:Uncharacterized protein n=1 Tax=Meloidogyne hapla TaxID=6305 RepID=A0A1I8B505_MELHA